MWPNRCDGELARGIPPSRRLMPFLMCSAQDSAVYYRFFVNAEQVLRLTERPPAGVPGPLTPTFFALRALGHTIAAYPELNRFVSGRRVYQRKDITVSLSAKKSFSPEAPVTVVKFPLDPHESLADMSRRLRHALEVGRTPRGTLADQEASLLLRLPPALLGLTFRLQRMLDQLNLLPAPLIEKDGFYASAFLANLGSIGLDAAYHHLYGYGNIPLFLTMGVVQPRLVCDATGKTTVSSSIEFKATVDDRVIDGLAAAKALGWFKNLLESPEQLVH